ERADGVAVAVGLRPVERREVFDHAFSFGAVWNGGVRLCPPSGRRGSAPAGGCRKRACSLRLLPESSCLLARAPRPVLSLPRRSAHSPVLLRRSVAGAHIKEKGHLIVMSMG